MQDTHSPVQITHGVMGIGCNKRALSRTDQHTGAREQAERTERTNPKGQGVYTEAGIGSGLISGVLQFEPPRPSQKKQDS